MHDHQLIRDESGELLLRLDEGRWRARLADLLRRCRTASSGEQAPVLREARLLLTLVPFGLAERLGEDRDPVAIEPMLAVGAYESAALALLPARASYMFSRGEAGGVHFASVLVPGIEDEVTMPGASAALALIAALVAALAGASMDETPARSPTSLDAADWLADLPPPHRLH